MAEIIVFLDGSSTVYKNNNGIKFGGIGIHIKNMDEYNISIPLIGKEVTNQKAELIACITAIKLCKKISNNNKIILYSDSMYTINCVTKWASEWEKNGWKRKTGEILNLKYIKELYEIVKGINIEFKHIKSHQKEPNRDSIEWDLWNGNNIVDKLAINAMNSIRKNIYIPSDTIIIN